jgi:hypothetical protein
MHITECRPEEEFKEMKLYTDDDIIEHREKIYEDDIDYDEDDEEYK